MSTETGPNVLLVHCHDLGRYLGCYGRDVDTPNVDALAAEGVTFENCFCTAPQCGPSRGSIHSGLYPQNNGVLGLIDWTFDDDVTTVAERFAAAGYDTHTFGPLFMNDSPASVGFQHAQPEPRWAVDVAEMTAEFLHGRSAENPFFAAVGFAEPHRPYVRDHVEDAAYRETDPNAVEPLPYLPDDPAVRADTAALGTLIENTVDPAVGRIRAALDETGHREDTLLVFTTDHGIAMPRAKGSCYDPGLRTALVLSQPGAFDGGRRVSALASNVDLFPTLLEAAGLDPQPGIDGRSLVPVATGESDAHRDAVFAQQTIHDRYHPLRAVRTPRYKYIRNFADFPAVYVTADMFDDQAGAAVVGEFMEPLPAEELYDLREDPNETENLASDAQDVATATEDPPEDPAAAEALATLRTRLREWMAETDDPLLDDTIPVTPPKRW
jgi:arylsulfatase A-like enzyme